MKFESLFFLCLVLCSCTKRESFNHIEIIGHGGMGVEHPMSIYHDNTVESVSLALQFPGLNGVEVDVQLDLDGELWLYHDMELDTETSGGGCIGSLHSNFIMDLNYNTIQGEKLCRLNQIVPLLDSSKVLFIDVKSFNSCDGLAQNPILFLESLNTALSNTKCQVRVIISNTDWLPYFIPFYQTYYSSDQHAEIENNINTHLGLTGVVVRYSSITESQVQSYKNQGLKVFLYEMRSPKGIKRALRKNPDGIIPDDIRRALIEGR